MKVQTRANLNECSKSGAVPHHTKGHTKDTTQKTPHKGHLCGKGTSRAHRHRVESAGLVRVDAARRTVA